jgi:hypothetical protein
MPLLRLARQCLLLPRSFALTHVSGIPVPRSDARTRGPHALLRDVVVAKSTGTRLTDDLLADLYQLALDRAGSRACARSASDGSAACTAGGR